MPGAPGEVADADAATWSVYQRMISLRRRHPWLTRAQTATSGVTNEQLLVRAWSDADGGRLTLALNLGDASFPLPGGVGAVLEAGAPVRDGAVAPHSWAVVEG